MPKMGRRLAGRAAMAISLKKERAKEHLKQMLEQSRTQSNDDALHALLKGNLGDMDGPVMLQKRLQSAQRVLKFITTNTVSVSIDALKTECSIKSDRAYRANRSLGFIIFFVTFAITLYLQRNGQRGEMMTRAMLEYFLTSQYYAPTNGDIWPHSEGQNCTNHLNMPSAAGCEIPPAELKTFMDIVVLEDVWDWLRLLFVERFYRWTWEDGQEMKKHEANTWMRKIRPISGLRMVQRRAAAGIETRDNLNGGCDYYNDGDMRKFAQECYDDLGYCVDGSCVFGHESYKPFGTFSNATKYRFERYRTGYSPTLYPDEVGYFVFFPHGGPTAKEDAKDVLESLMADRWIDKWVRVDFLALNADERLIFMARFMLHFEVSGLVVPIVTVDTYQVNYYDTSNALDLLRIFAEACVVVLWIYNLAMQLLEFKKFRGEHPELSFRQALWRNAAEDTHSIILDMQLVLAVPMFFLWALTTIDPHQGNLQIRAEEVDWEGTPIFLSQLAVYSRAYFMLAGLMFLLFVLRVIQQARMNPRFSLLSESIDLMKYRLLNFAIVLCLFVIMFANMAVIMFGDKVPAFSEYHTALIMISQMVIGSAENRRQNSRRGGGEGEVQSIEYSGVYEESPTTAFIWYYPFFTVMVLIVINIVVAIIGESYATVKHNRSPESEGYALTPSEALDGHPTRLTHQVFRGIRQRIRKQMGPMKGEMSKQSILGMMSLLPESFDTECASAAELLLAADAAKLPLTEDNIKWIIERYPCIINSSEDLEALLVERTPPPPSAKKRLSGLADTVEDIVNQQAANHAKIDLLIRMATV